MTNLQKTPSGEDKPLRPQSAAERAAFRSAVQYVADCRYVQRRKPDLAFPPSGDTGFMDAAIEEHVARIDEMIREMERNPPAVYGLLEEYRARSGMTKAELTRRAFLSQNTYESFGQPEHTITQVVLFKLALALRLTREETERLLLYAGRSSGGMAAQTQVELIAFHCIDQRIYDVETVGQIMMRFHDGKDVFKIY